MYTLYGIPNCNTVKKAMNALEAKGVSYEFINFKKQAPTQKLIKSWKTFFQDWPVNKKGPTFRKLKDEFEQADSSGKMKLIIEKSSAIKRPILMQGEKVLCMGFDEDFYQQL
jgi:arsenate reductase